MDNINKMSNRREQVSQALHNAFINGFASLLDGNDRIVIQRRQSSLHGLHSDWEAVGKYLKSAIKRYCNE